MSAVIELFVLCSFFGNSQMTVLKLIPLELYSYRLLNKLYMYYSLCFPYIRHPHRSLACGVEQEIKGINLFKTNKMFDDFYIKEP